MAMGYAVDADSAYGLAQRPLLCHISSLFRYIRPLAYIYNYGMFPYVNKVTLFVNNVPLPIFCVCIPHIGVSAVALKFCRDINGS